jgi:O-antigen biosynthesis protein
MHQMVTESFPKISLCIIAKDEEDFIEECIKSVSSVVYETILVDTGSKDSTKNKASSLGAKIFDFPWVDDFSEARNYGISKSLGDWILVLDADEQIGDADCAKIQKLTQNTQLCYEMTQRHYTNDIRLSGFIPAKKNFPEYEKHFAGYFESSLVRLFPNFPGLFYKGRIHELVEPSISELGMHKIVGSGIIIHHYGHTPEVKKKKDKHKLYKPLGEVKTQETPNDWKAYFELGVELNNKGDLKGSVEAFEVSLRLNPKDLSSWVNAGYVLCELGRYDEALNALQKAIEIDKRCFEAYCNRGVVYMRKKEWVHAERNLKIALHFNSEYVNAYCNLGKVYASSNRYSEAANIFHRAIDILPQCIPAYINLAVLFLQSPYKMVGKQYLKKAKEIAPSSDEVMEVEKMLESS